jgi:hypothetical protein
MSQDAWDEAKRRQRIAQSLIERFTAEQSESYRDYCDTLGMEGSPYDWPGWAECPEFLDPRDGWSR